MGPRDEPPGDLRADEPAVAPRVREGGHPKVGLHKTQRF